MPPYSPPRPPAHLLHRSRPASTLHPGSSPERWVTTGSRSGTRQPVSVPTGPGPLLFAWCLPSAPRALHPVRPAQASLTTH
ncbi:hypothetical protein NDU88_005372 [Pleurodeles waltl]|uniref:Uncharacterized protein n=1 Tax=Pleurodeles waltl TaxID=8319 RepID=A0AAV7QKI1_PLEWA|nr:hypothetical protein NDU88_005372 [Pleurodeles waltl]